MKIRSCPSCSSKIKSRSYEELNEPNEAKVLESRRDDNIKAVSHADKGSQLSKKTHVKTRQSLPDRSEDGNVLSDILTERLDPGKIRGKHSKEDRNPKDNKRWDSPKDILPNQTPSCEMRVSDEATSSTSSINLIKQITNRKTKLSALVRKRGANKEIRQEDYEKNNDTCDGEVNVDMSTSKGDDSKDKMQQMDYDF